MKVPYTYEHISRTKQFGKFKCVSHETTRDTTNTNIFRLLINGIRVIRHEVNDFEKYSTNITGYSRGEDGKVFKTLKSLICYHEHIQCK
jgi:hypothetical protein